MKIVLLIALGIMVIAVVIVFGCATTRKGYESAKYTVVVADESTEVRNYPALIVAETPMPETGDRAQNSGFMNLFQYISGNNERQQKIPMTTPVLVVGTATNSASTNAAMAFVMPGKFSFGDLPRPTTTNVILRQMEPARYAVRRFSGSRKDALLARETETLLRWLETKNIAPLAAPFFAFYDPPWTPGFLRRNEVLIRIPSPTHNAVP